MSSIILGIAALVAINSFNYNLVNDIDRQAASLLGADLTVNGNREIAPKLKAKFDSLPGESARELELFSMASLEDVNEMQFVRLKALQGNFPFYGKLKTVPVEAATDFRNSNGALVDDGFMIQHGLSVGDSIKLGYATFYIAGRLQSAFGSAGVTSSFAPTIYISLSELNKTKLVKEGSLVDYTYYKKLPEGFDADAWEEEQKMLFRNEGMRITTVKERKEALNEAFDMLNYFLNAVALVSLLLGCIGVASSVFIYVKNKIPSIAVLRCLGLKGRQAFLIYFIQIFILGSIAVALGAFLGSFIQLILPLLLSDFLPLEVTTVLSWKAIGEGLVVGSTVTILFALLPLISVRRISPLRTLRSSFEEEEGERDYLSWLVYFGIIISIFVFLWYLMSDLIMSAYFTVGLILSFVLLYSVSKAIMWAVRKYFPRKWSFVLRQGLANLYRPNNQTQTLLISIGLGTAVLAMLFIIQGLLLKNVQQMDAGNQPNMILYGIETDQRDSLAAMTRENGLPLIQQVPIVTIRLEEWKGRTKSEWLADTVADISRWAANREARVTYRDSLDPFDKLVAGKFIGEYKGGNDSIFVSLGADFAEQLKVGIGDELIYNVQGTRIKTYVSSLRKLDFTKMQARFFIVFPTGVLEEAPQFHVLVTKSPDTKTTAEFRGKVVTAFPNVSVVDLGMILQALGDILDKVSYIIKFMAAFSILTGLIVLISSLLLSKFQRIKESVLLRTIGASRKQILQINATEYVLLGALSAATGICISLAGSFLLATFVLELPFNIQWLPILAVFLFVVGLTVVIGMINTREVVSKSPLEVLRKEVE
ncbi:MAG: FtsX-like permease family protein [Chitinophagales bacterium]|nr:FtsX-like permease family protein [Chitinophagales bacterium]